MREEHLTNATKGGSWEEESGCEGSAAGLSCLSTRSHVISLRPT